MDELSALDLVAESVGAAGDDAAVVDGATLSTDMLHDTTDFPAGTTRYTQGWRSVAVSLSDLAAMGVRARATVAAYGAPSFEEGDLQAFLRGAREVCAAVDAEYVGGDLDHHGEFTVATTALGGAEDPVYRSGATPGDRVCVTGRFGRTAAAVALFDRGETDRANDLFQFTPRVRAGRAIGDHATAMMDVSDGLARSLHQVGRASDCGFTVSTDAVPVHPAVEAVSSGPEDRRERTLFFGEDFELLFTVDADAVEPVREAAPLPVEVIGEVLESADARVTADGDPMPDRGYTHGG